MTIEDRGGTRLAELLADPDRAQRVAQIRQQIHDDDRVYSRTRALILQAANQTHAELARRLGVGQETISELEHQSDLLLSTLYSCLAAVGTHARIVLTVGERDVEIDLASVART